MNLYQCILFFSGKIRSSFFFIFFIKEPFFTYFFAAREPGFYGAVNVQTGKAILFVPRLPADYATWMGDLWTCDDFKKRYQVDEVFYVDEVSFSYILYFNLIFHFVVEFCSHDSSSILNLGNVCVKCFVFFVVLSIKSPDL